MRRKSNLANCHALTKVVMDPITIVFITGMGALAESRHPAILIAGFGVMSVLAMPHSRHLRMTEHP